MAGSVPVPPIFNVAPLPTVNVPPLVARFAVNVDKSSVPPETVRSPATVAVPARVFVALPLIARKPYVSALTVWVVPA